MARGGVRLGAGRPKGTTKAKKIADIAEVVVKALVKPNELPKVEADPPPVILEQDFDDPKDFLHTVMNTTALPMPIRQDAAKALMPYVHAKKEVSKKGEADAKAKAAGSKFAASPPPPRLAVNNG